MLDEIEKFKKIIKIGDTICLLNEDGTVTEYVINDICVYMNEGGHHSIGFFVNEQEAPIDYEVYRQLFKDCLMWKKGWEVVMGKMRNIRQKRLAKND